MYSQHEYISTCKVLSIINLLSQASKQSTFVNMLKFHYDSLKGKTKVSFTFYCTNMHVIGPHLAIDTATSTEGQLT